MSQEQQVTGAPLRDGLVGLRPEPCGLGHSATIPSAAAQRQRPVTLNIALATAVSMMRTQAAAYRNPHGEGARRMDKNVRKSLAAELDEMVRLIVSHAQAIETRSAKTEGLGPQDESAVRNGCAQPPSENPSDPG